MLFTFFIVFNCFITFSSFFYADCISKPLIPSQSERALPEEEALRFISEIERYMKGIYMLSGDFTQTVTFKNKKQQTLNGQFYMHKPDKKTYKIQIDFPDQKLVIIHEILYIMDLKRKSTSKYSLDATPITFLFSGNLNLRKQFSTYFVYYYPNKKMMHITLQTSRDSLTKISLFFSLYSNRNIKYLLGWSIKDIQGNLTNVHFHEQTLIANNPAALKANLFDPKKY